MLSKRIFRFSLILATSIFFLASCQKESTSIHYTASEYDELSRVLNLPGELFNYQLGDVGALINIIPQNIENSITPDRFNHQATLGRVIFYDELLSRNGTVSCGSCHIQSAGFADNNRGSEGFDGGTTTRNTLALGTASVGLTNSYGGGEAFANGTTIDNITTFPGSGATIAGFSWDDTVHSMEAQTEGAITNPLEMGMTMQDMVTRIKSIAYYDILFKKAFGEDQINEGNLLKAVSTFVNAITTNESKFDEAFQNSNGAFETFTQEENLGRQLYNTNCASCHSFNHDFTVKAVGNNGLAMNYTDQGKGAKTGMSEDMGVFKIPFLRNIELTAPYMHDGSLATLEEVVDHYSDKIEPHANLSPELKNGNTVKRMNFTPQQKSALVAYLKTLTDYKMIADTKLSDPFKG